MIKSNALFAAELRKQGVDLEGIIWDCEEIMLDYSWYSKFAEDGVRERYERRNFITLYTVNREEINPKTKKDKISPMKKKKKRKEEYKLVAREIARVFTKKRLNDADKIRGFLEGAYASLLDEVDIPESIKVRAYYLKGRPNEQDLGYL